MLVELSVDDPLAEYAYGLGSLLGVTAGVGR